MYAGPVGAAPGESLSIGTDRTPDTANVKWMSTLHALQRILFYCGRNMAKNSSGYSTVGAVSNSFKFLEPVTIIRNSATGWVSAITKSHVTQRYTRLHAMPHDVRTHTQRQTERRTAGTNTDQYQARRRTANIKQLIGRRLIQSTCSVMIQYIISCCSRRCFAVVLQYKCINRPLFAFHKHSEQVTYV